MKSLLALAAAVSLLFSAPAAGQGYVAFGLGTNDHQSIVFGYQLTPRFSVEASALRMGSEAPPVATGIPAVPTVDAQTSGYSIGLVGNYPIAESWALLGRVGANYLRTKYEEGTSTTQGLIFSVPSSTEWVSSVGAGVEFKLAPPARLRLIYEHFAGDFPINTLTMSVAVNF